MSFDAISAKMREDWDARENARYFFVDSQSEWSGSEFYALGQMTFRYDILKDMENVCLLPGVLVSLCPVLLQCLITVRLQPMLDKLGALRAKEL